jgi:class 3 adenylate cyclase
MSSFSATTRQLGICHFLGLIQRMRELIPRFISAAGGTLLKCETDNCYAFFPDADAALQASVRINAEIARINATEEEDDQMYLSIGIDRGEMLLIGDEDFYGDPVNTASKLGEDLAGRAETLITDRALADASVTWLDEVAWRESEISGIRIRYACLRHEDARG